MLNNVSHLIYIVFSPILSTIFIVMNAITIYVFKIKFRLNSVCTILIVNICACDIFVCLFSNTFYVMNLIHPKYAWTTGSLCCKIFKFLTMFANVAQIYFLCFLTADRYRRLVNATLAQWTKRHGIHFVIIGWLSAFVLTVPRLILFDQKIMMKGRPSSNATEIVNVVCKPIGLGHKGYITMTVLLFVLGYAIPAIFIVYSAIRTQIFLWKRRNTIHISNTSNFVTKMKSKLSMTFNLTASFFMIIWTPFFLLSVIDLTLGLLGKKELFHVNFTLRCSLLIAGSAKPIIYIICLDKFRQCFAISTDTTKDTAIETTSQQQPGTNDTNLTGAAKKKTIHKKSSTDV